MEKKCKICGERLNNSCNQTGIYFSFFWFKIKANSNASWKIGLSLIYLLIFVGVLLGIILFFQYLSKVILNL